MIGPSDNGHLAPSNFEDLLIDRVMPDFHFVEYHQIQVRARPEVVFQSVLTLDLSYSLVVRALYAARSLPALFTGRKMNESLGFDLPGMMRAGFVVLGREAGRELLLGLVGKFWRPSGEILRISPDEFGHFDQPGHAKAVWNFAIAPQKNDWSLLSTETRILCTDDAARRSFSRYWFFVRPFSGLIRSEALRSIRATSEYLI